MRPARFSESSPGLALAYSQRCRFAATYTEGVRKQKHGVKKFKGLPLIIL
jgi:hypothetical protein